MVVGQQRADLPAAPSTVPDDPMLELRARGLRPTPLRFAVICELARGNAPVCFADLLVRVRHALPRPLPLAPSALRRTLDQLVAAGVMRSSVDGEEVWYALGATTGSQGVTCERLADRPTGGVA